MSDIRTNGVQERHDFLSSNGDILEMNIWRRDIWLVTQSDRKVNDMLTVINDTSDISLHEVILPLLGGWGDWGMGSCEICSRCSDVGIPIGIFAYVDIKLVN